MGEEEGKVPFGASRPGRACLQCIYALSWGASRYGCIRAQFFIAFTSNALALAALAPWQGKAPPGLVWPHLTRAVAASPEGRRCTAMAIAGVLPARASDSGD